jgi:hypothetical protein
MAALVPSAPAGAFEVWCVLPIVFDFWILPIGEILKFDLFVRSLLS